jgi:hypothetical protein
VCSRLEAGGDAMEQVLVETLVDEIFVMIYYFFSFSDFESTRTKDSRLII